MNSSSLVQDEQLENQEPKSCWTS